MKFELVVGTAIVVACGVTEAAAVNCAQVNRYLATGRTTQDVAETMVVPEEDVKKCQAEASTAAPAAMVGDAAKPAAAVSVPPADK